MKINFSLGPNACQVRQGEILKFWPMQTSMSGFVYTNWSVSSRYNVAQIEEHVIYV
jgi:hypothetical protein